MSNTYVKIKYCRVFYNWTFLIMHNDNINENSYLNKAKTKKFIFYDALKNLLCK